MTPDQHDVVVIGGGISGLTVAWHLTRAGFDVCLLESQTTVGGCTQTGRRDGFLLEKGPFNVMVRDPAFEALLVALSHDLTVVPATRSARRRFIYSRGRLQPVPTQPIALATTRLLSLTGRCRLLAGLLFSSRPANEEESIEQAATRRFGREVADTIVSAAVAGIYAGDISKLSLAACFPAVASLDARTRSLLGQAVKSVLTRAKRKPHRRWRGLVSIDGGLGAITGALGGALGDGLRTGCEAAAVEQTAGGYTVEYRNDRMMTQHMTCRQLVIASSAACASRLLPLLIPESAPILDSIECASVVVLNLGFRRDDVDHPLRGFGFLVPRSEPNVPFMGVLFADSVFPHHAPPDRRLIRVFLGGPRDGIGGSNVRVSNRTAEDPSRDRQGAGTFPFSDGRGSVLLDSLRAHAIDESDQALLSATMCALRPILGIKSEPVLVDICRHRNAIPQYHLGHLDRIRRLRALVAAKPALHLVGNYLEGVSLNDCVRLAANVANEILRSESQRGSTPGSCPPRQAAPASSAVAQ